MGSSVKVRLGRSGPYYTITDSDMDSVISNFFNFVSGEPIETEAIKMISSPPAKKKLFSSPGGSSSASNYSSPSSRFSSPSSSKFSTPSPSSKSSKENITGYINAIGEVQKGEKYKYFDIKVNVASGDNINVRVMMIGSMQANFQQHLNKPVALTGISSNNGKRFFTEKYGAKLTPCPYTLSFSRKPMKVTSVKDVQENMTMLNVSGRFAWLTNMKPANGGWIRDGVVADATGAKIISIWREQVINSLNNNNIYLFTNLNTKWSQNGFKFQTTGLTVVALCDNESSNVPATVDLLPFRDESGILQLKDPNVLTAHVKSIRVCRNAECKKEFQPKQNDAFPICPHCNHSCKLLNLGTKIECSITVEIEDEDIKLTASEELIRSVPAFERIPWSDMVNSLLMTKGTFVVNMETRDVLAIENANLQNEEEYLGEFEFGDVDDLTLSVHAPQETPEETPQETPHE